MKVLLYSGNLKLVTKSGVGEAVRHQQKMLDYLGIPYTTDPKADYDVVHINTIFPDALRMSRRAKRAGKKVLYYGHSTMEDFRNSFKGSNLVAPFFKWWIKQCYNSADIVVTPTPYSKDLLETYGLSPEILSLSNGIDTSFFAPDKAAGQRFRDRYQLSASDKVVLSVGHYIERKGILDFVKLAKQFPEYQFFWFGYTNLNLVPYNVRFAVQSSPLNLHFPGYVDRESLKEAYCGSDAFMFLTHEETEGIVLLEALATQIPTVVRDIPIYRHSLPAGVYVYKGQNVAEFATHLANVINHTYPDLTAQGYAHARANDLTAVAGQLADIYSHKLGLNPVPTHPAGAVGQMPADAGKKSSANVSAVAATHTKPRFNAMGRE